MSGISGPEQPAPSDGAGAPVPNPRSSAEDPSSLPPQSSASPTAARDFFAEIKAESRLAEKRAGWIGQIKADLATKLTDSDALAPEQLAAVEGAFTAALDPVNGVYNPACLVELLSDEKRRELALNWRQVEQIEAWVQEFGRAAVEFIGTLNSELAELRAPASAPEVAPAEDQSVQPAVGAPNASAATAAEPEEAKADEAPAPETAALSPGRPHAIFSAKREQWTAAIAADLISQLVGEDKLSEGIRHVVIANLYLSFDPEAGTLNNQKLDEFLGRQRAREENDSRFEFVKAWVESYRNAVTALIANPQTEISLEYPTRRVEEEARRDDDTKELSLAELAGAAATAENSRDEREGPTQDTAGLETTPEILEAQRADRELAGRIDGRRFFLDEQTERFSELARGLGSENSFEDEQIAEVLQAMTECYQLSDGQLDGQRLRDRLAPLLMTLNTQQEWFLEGFLDDFCAMAGNLAEETSHIDYEVEDRARTRAIPFHEVILAGNVEVEFSARRGGHGQQGSISIDIRHVDSGALIKIVDRDAYRLNVQTLQRAAAELREIEAGSQGALERRMQEFLEGLITLAKADRARVFTILGDRKLDRVYGSQHELLATVKEDLLAVDESDRTRLQVESLTSGRRETTFILRRGQAQPINGDWDSLTVRRVGEEVRLILQGGPAVGDRKGAIAEIEVVVDKAHTKNLPRTVAFLLEARDAEELGREASANNGLGEFARDVLQLGRLSKLRNMTISGQSDLPEINLTSRFVIENVRIEEGELHLRGQLDGNAGSIIKKLSLHKSAVLGLHDCQGCGVDGLSRESGTVLMGDLSGSEFRNSRLIVTGGVFARLRGRAPSGSDGGGTVNLKLTGVTLRGFSNVLPEHAVPA
ncbi:MAG: hypothetical protein K1X79_11735 [Oligoflexia bacterium]|nr:hypothetical protein [Oligoflexia bacterium]